MQAPTTMSPSRSTSKKCWPACSIAAPERWLGIFQSCLRSVVLDTRTQTVTVEGKPVELTTFEYRILEHLMLKAADVISKTDLTEQLYEQDFERDSNVIEVFIGRLRRKLDPDDRIKPIETLRGRGYRFALARNPG